MLGKLKRIFICAERRFPRGDAGANRVQYIARALMQAGHEVIVVSIGENRSKDFCEQRKLYIYNQVKYKNVPVRDGLLKRWDANIVSGFNTVDILKEFGLNSTDFVLIYTTNPIYGQIVCNYSHKKIGAKVALDVVERFQSFQYNFGRFDPKFLLFTYCFNEIYPRTGKVIAVSKHLEKYFNDMGLCVFYLPALIDPTEHVIKNAMNDGIIRMIYPGDLGKKEAIVDMLKGFLMLSDSEKARIEFHITRTGKRQLVKILGDQMYLIDQMGKILHFHNWMSYESLLSLYSRMDFLFFVRSANEATLSNFPSKVPELLACGIPTIANRVGDFSEYLQDGIDSILFDKCTAEDCCAAIRRALKLKPAQLKEMGENARRCAEQKFDFRIWSNKLHKFIQGD